MQKRRYPRLSIRSKTELSRHISHKGFPREQALKLINRVLADHSRLWKDSAESEPETGKYVRTAVGTPLGILLEKINERVLAPHDNKLPSFIFGGRSGTNHVAAAMHLLGSRRRRVLGKLDVSRFFEQISENRVRHFFRQKCDCTDVVAKLLAAICCVPRGPKGSRGDLILARGFATSSRLAVWCTLEIFIELDRQVRKRFRNHDPRIAVFVDDIGIMASRVSKEDMKLMVTVAEGILNDHDPHQRLPLNRKKTKIVSHEEGIEHLGLRLGRNRVTIGGKTRAKFSRLHDKLRTATNAVEKKEIREKIKSTKYYRRYVENFSAHKKN